MININKEKIDKNIIASITLKSAIDLSKISYINWEKFGLSDEFTKEELENNCDVGELQITFSDFIGTKININRYGAEDLSDIEFN